MHSRCAIITLCWIVQLSVTLAHYVSTITSTSPSRQEIITSSVQPRQITQNSSLQNLKPSALRCQHLPWFHASPSRNAAADKIFNSFLDQIIAELTTTLRRRQLRHPTHPTTKLIPAQLHTIRAVNTICLLVARVHHSDLHHPNSSRSSTAVLNTFQSRPVAAQNDPSQRAYFVTCSTVWWVINRCRFGVSANQYRRCTTDRQTDSQTDRESAPALPPFAMASLAITTLPLVHC